MADLFSENNNRQRLRDYMDNVKLPCIPYLGKLLNIGTLIFLALAISSGEQRTEMGQHIKVWYCRGLVVKPLTLYTGGHSLIPSSSSLSDETLSCGPVSI